MSTEGQPASDTVAMIDIVFTAMVTIGLTPEVLGKEHLTGLLSEPWVKAALTGEPQFPSHEEYLHLGLFLVGLLTLLLSWFGVHRSLQAQPIKFETFWGMLRFVLDVALILLYGVILIFFQQIQPVLFLLATTYGLYGLWDVFKTIEYRQDYWKRLRPNRIEALAHRKWVEAGQPARGSEEFWPTAQTELASYRWPRALKKWGGAVFRVFPRQLVSIEFAFFFLVLCCLSNQMSAWSALVVAFALTVLYRVTKDYPLRGSIGTTTIYCVIVFADCLLRRSS